MSLIQTARAAAIAVTSVATAAQPTQFDPGATFGASESIRATYNPEPPAPQSKSTEGNPQAQTSQRAESQPTPGSLLRRREGKSDPEPQPAPTKPKEQTPAVETKPGTTPATATPTATPTTENKSATETRSAASQPVPGSSAKITVLTEEQIKALPEAELKKLIGELEGVQRDKELGHAVLQARINALNEANSAVRNNSAQGVAAIGKALERQLANEQQNLTNLGKTVDSKRQNRAKEYTNGVPNEVLRELDNEDRSRADLARDISNHENNLWKSREERYRRYTQINAEEETRNWNLTPAGGIKRGVEDILKLPDRVLQGPGGQPVKKSDIEIRAEQERHAQEVSGVEYFAPYKQLKNPRAEVGVIEALKPLDRKAAVDFIMGPPQGITFTDAELREKVVQLQRLVVAADGELQLREVRAQRADLSLAETLGKMPKDVRADVAAQVEAYRIAREAMAAQRVNLERQQTEIDKPRLDRMQRESFEAWKQKDRTVIGAGTSSLREAKIFNEAQDRLVSTNLNEWKKDLDAEYQRRARVLGR